MRMAGARWDLLAVGVVVTFVTLAGVWVLFGDPLGDISGSTTPSGPGENESTIDACTTITEPGRYILNEDIGGDGRDTCIRISTSNVILQGHGHRVDGTGRFGSAGVIAEGNDTALSNVTVRNLTVTGWDDAIRYVNITDGAIIGTTSAESRVGVALLNARENTVADNVARRNSLRGISLLESSANNTLLNNTALDNGQYGIHLVEPGVTNNTLRTNAVSGNEFGIALIDSHGNRITDNTANTNRIAGIWLSAARRNVIADNTASNRFYGVFLSDRSNGNSITRNTVTETQVGIRLRSSDDNTVVDNAIRSSGDNAILLLSSDANEITGNYGGDNVRGITVLRSMDNTVSNNTVGRSTQRTGEDA